MRGIVSGMMLILLFIGMLTSAFNIQPVRASGTIYILADGSVDPPTATISSDDNVTYTFTDDINDSIVVERSNIIIDGNGYTLQGFGSENGFFLFSINTVTIKNVYIKGFVYGVRLFSASNNTLVGNNIASNTKEGIQLYDSSNNTISGNNITANNLHGIVLWHSSNHNSISENNIASNYCGIRIGSCSDNLIYHNNLIDNIHQADIYKHTPGINFWDDDYPSGGNYWSDYTGVDVTRGSGQDQPGSDGIGDTSYVVDTDNLDHYPLMNPHGSPPPQTYDLTITAIAGGSTDPALGTYSYTANSTVQVTASPCAGYEFDHWELDGSWNHSNPISVTMDSDHVLHVVFTYRVTIKAHCYAEGVDVSVGVTMDGSPTGYTTPYTFTGLTGTHTFTVPGFDAKGHPFKQWNTGQTNTTITVNSGGTYTAYYDTNYTLTITATTGGITDPAPGTYTYWSGAVVGVTATPDDGCYLDCWILDDVNIGSFNPVDVHMKTNHTLHAAFAQLSSGHNVAVKGLSPKTVVAQGYPSTIKTLTMNVGSYTETFNVTVYADQNTTTIGDEVIIGNQTVSSLRSGNFTTVTFVWNTTGLVKGNYTISAYAWPVPGETDLADNNLTDGIVQIVIPGDVDGNGIVEIKDIVLIAMAYGCTPGQPCYDPNLDINCDGIIDIKDIVITALHYGETEP